MRQRLHKQWQFVALTATLCGTWNAAGQVNATAVEATPPPVTWIMPPVPLDVDIDERTLEALGAAIRDVWRTEDTTAVHGLDALLARGPEPQIEAAPLRAALDLVAAGEERYMAFEFLTAAAALAEAAGQLSAQLGRLDGEALHKLCRARALEGVAWLEAGNKAAALEAFGKLLSVRPDFQPDAGQLPPAASQLLEQARGQLRDKGLGWVDIVSQPSGATVWVDSQFRGRTPVTVRGLPVGPHYLRVTAPGRAPHEELVELTRDGLTRTLVMTPGPLGDRAARVVGALQAGASGGSLQTDLQGLRDEAALGDIVIIGVAKRDAQRLVVSAVRWSQKPVAGVVIADVGPDIAAAARDIGRGLRGGAWPAIQLPADGPRLDVDYDRSLLGIGPGWGRAEVAPAGGLLTAWWFWTGAAVLAGGTAALLLSIDREAPVERGPDRVLFSVDYVANDRGN